MINAVNYVILNVALSELLLTLQLCTTVEGLYQVEVRLLDYENPTQRCQDCPFLNGFRSCCDDFSRSTGCTGSSRECDNQFTFCLRPFGNDSSHEGGCSDGERMTSGINRNSETIDFTQDTVLRLDNPFHLQGLTNDYTVSECMHGPSYYYYNYSI